MPSYQESANQGESPNDQFRCHSPLWGGEPREPPNPNKGKSQKEFEIPNDNKQFLK